MTQVFIFGNAKAGFPLHESTIAGSAYLGRYRTTHPYPLVVAGRWYAPVMFDEPGTGVQVHGELYELELAALARLDALESIGLPGNFRRPVHIESIDTGQHTTAFAYMRSRALTAPIHSDYLAAYDDPDRRYVPPWERSKAS
jgi:gamma-glutamylaminecyclotransferase